MKILHINDHYQLVGGAEVIIFRMLEALEIQGNRNVIVHQHPTNVITEWRRVYEVSGLGDPYSQQSSVVAGTLRRILQEEKPDLIHIHDIGNPDVSEISHCYAPTIQSVFNHSFYCPGGMKYLPLLGKTCECQFGRGCLVSSFLTHCNSIRPRVLLSSYRRSYRMMKRTSRLVFLTISEYQARCLVQNGCSPEQIKVLHPFTVLPEPDESEETFFRQSTILFTGRVYPYKGLDRLLQSIIYLKSPFRLIVDGDGPDLGRAKRLVHRLGLGDRVEFVGWAPREQHLAYYRQASVVAVPSVWPEPFGMVGIEAMSYGKPVVAFNVGGIPEWLEHGVTGLLIEPYDVKEMAKKIDFLLENPDIAREMGMRGRKKVEAEFNKEKHVTRLLEIYQEVIDGRTRSTIFAH